MPNPDSFVLLIMGVVFVAVGLGVHFGSKRSEQKYSDGLAERTDAREFLESTPESSGYGALRIGALISIVVGAVLLGIAGGIRLWG